MNSPVEMVTSRPVGTRRFLGPPLCVGHGTCVGSMGAIFANNEKVQKKRWINLIIQKWYPV